MRGVGVGGSRDVFKVVSRCMVLGVGCGGCNGEYLRL